MYIQIIIYFSCSAFRQSLLLLKHLLHHNFDLVYISQLQNVIGLICPNFTIYSKQMIQKHHQYSCLSI